MRSNNYLHESILETSKGCVQINVISELHPSDPGSEGQVGQGAQGAGQGDRVSRRRAVMKQGFHVWGGESAKKCSPPRELG